MEKIYNEALYLVRYYNEPGEHYISGFKLKPQVAQGIVKSYRDFCEELARFGTCE